MERNEPITIVRTVARRPRPAICEYLSSIDGSVPIDDLATHLVAVADSRSDGRRIPRSHGRLATRLRHVHLPKLDEVNVIEYDSERNEVSPGKNLPLTEPVLGTLDRMNAARRAGTRGTLSRHD